MQIRTTALRAALAALLALPGVATAQDPLELGVIRDDDVHVVQDLLYPKSGRTELGVHLGVMAFDPYVTSPNAQLSFNTHMNERWSISVMAGGGYGFKTGVYRTLESPTYGVAPYAYRYLGSVLVGPEFSPIYAKMNLNGAKVFHFDIYFAARAGLTIEQSILPDGTLAFGPTLSPAVGSRTYLGPNTAFRLEFRDDLMIERRGLTQSTEFKQNGNVVFGLTFLSKVKER